MFHIPKWAPQRRNDLVRTLTLTATVRKAIDFAKSKYTYSKEPESFKGAEHIRRILTEHIPK